MKRLISLNNLFILRAYQQGQGIRAEIKGGLALPGQKLNLVGLELLADAKVDNEKITKGSIAYIPEDFLMTHDWAKKVRKSEAVDGEFIAVESKYVYMVESKDV